MTINNQTKKKDIQLLTQKINACQYYEKISSQYS